jgi:hypothetical protein
VIRRLPGSPLTWAVLVMLLIGGGFGMYWFQPWKLVTDRTIAETAPVVDEPAPKLTAPEVTAPAMPVPAADQPSADRLLSTGTLITHEHDTSGAVRVTRLADGRRILTIADLNTSNGPDLRVWLADRPVVAGRAGWFVFDDGKYLELGRLKGNRGTQNYEIPQSADLAALRSVTIWCKRFSVSFGAAELADA